MKPKLLLPEAIGLPKSDIEEIYSLASVTLYRSFPTESERLKEMLKDVDIIVTSFIKISSDIFESSPVLKCVITTTVGTELIDVESAKKHNIIVVNCPTQNTEAVASLVISFIFALSRRILEANQSIKDGNWEPLIFRGFELKNKILGLVGYGRIAKEVSSIANFLGMQIIWVDSKSSSIDVDKLVSTSDFISIHTPSNNSTINLFDERRLRLIKPSSYLINVSRGNIVNQAALLKCLQERSLAGAALDVFVGEPLNGKLNDDIIQLAKLPCVIATPHLGFNTEETFERMGKEVISNIKSFINGKTLNVIEL
jgi:phosphoglycerate dehydrogenase-like enzyme